MGTSSNDLDDVAASGLGDSIPDPNTRNARNLACWMDTWVRNSYENFAMLREVDESLLHSLGELKGIGRGKPAIVLAAGPSLDDSLDGPDGDLIRTWANEQKALLFCSNSIIRPTLARGVEPFSFTIMHPTLDVLEGFEVGPKGSEIGIATKGRKLITSPTVHPAVLGQWLDHDMDEARREGNGGDVYLCLQFHSDTLRVIVSEDKENSKLGVANLETFHQVGGFFGSVQHAAWNMPGMFPGSAWPWLNREDKQPLPGIPNLGCVANFGIKVAAVCGCSPIILVGFDYSFTPDAEGKARFRADDWRWYPGEIGWKRVPRRRENEKLRMMQFPLFDAPNAKGETRLAHEPMIGYRNNTHWAYKNALDLDEEPLDLVNCSLDGIVTELPRMPLADVLGKVQRGEWVKRAKEAKAA